LIALHSETILLHQQWFQRVLSTSCFKVEWRRSRNSCNKLLLTSSVHNTRMTVQCWCVAGRRLASAAPTCRRLESCTTGRVSPCPTVSSHRGPAWGRRQAGATRRQRPPSGLYLAQGSRLVIRNGLFVFKFTSMNFYFKIFIDILSAQNIQLFAKYMAYL